MARPREFDSGVVLDRAIEAFWEDGYEATSIQRLVERTGVQRGSLYGAFGDKHALFLAALDRYEQFFYSRILANLDAPGSPKEAIQNVFEKVVRECACVEGRKGCLMTNAAVELGGHDPDTEARVASSFRRVEECFFRSLGAAQQLGEVSRKADARTLARFLTNSLQGLRVMSKACPDRRVLDDVVRATLSVLDG